MNWDIDGPHFEQGEPVYLAEIIDGPHAGQRFPIPEPTETVRLSFTTRVEVSGGPTAGGRHVGDSWLVPNMITTHRYELVRVQQHGAVRTGFFEHKR